RREKLEVENRLLQLEQKALQLQMNPHFIFNALTSIQALITEQNYPTARQEINQFAKLMRSILANSRRQTISLQEEANTLEQY
ncbi:MAG: histidine kinase, partial [Thermoanaerobaculia bacterium]|nr:histidine kinase [Thermoanaerobaculia bacterium]